MGERSQAENVFLESFWVVNVKDESDAGSPFQVKAEFSHDVEGNEREDQIGARFGANMSIFAKALVCNGQRHMERLHDGQVELDYRGRRWAWKIIHEDQDIGCHRTPSSFQRTKFWSRCIMTSRCRVSCSGGCCGTRLLPASTMI